MLCVVMTEIVFYEYDRVSGHSKIEFVNEIMKEKVTTLDK